MSTLYLAIAFVAWGVILRLHDWAAVEYFYEEQAKNFVALGLLFLVHFVITNNVIIIQWIAQ